MRIPPEHPVHWGAPERGRWWGIAKRAVRKLEARATVDGGVTAERLILREITLLGLDPLDLSHEFLLALVESKTDDEWLANVWLLQWERPWR